MQKFGKQSLWKFFYIHLARCCLLYLPPLVHDMLFYDVTAFSYQVEHFLIFLFKFIYFYNFLNLICKLRLVSPLFCFVLDFILSQNQLHYSSLYLFGRLCLDWLCFSHSLERYSVERLKDLMLLAYMVFF